MEELLKAWGVRATEVRATGEGTNNASYFVGDEFVLRIHHNTTAPDYEHAVLRALDGLSFAVPVPIVAEDGATVVRGELGGQLVTASLSRRIPGEHPRGGDAAEACGDALTELDEALAKLDPATLPARNVWDGDLTKLHPRVGDLGELLASLDGAERRERVAVPDLQLLREAASLVHWYGRHLQGLTTAADITTRADRLLQVERQLAR